MYYIKINYDPKKKPFELVSIPDEPWEWLHTVYDLISCDCIEVANTFIEDLVLVLDESEKLYDNWDLKINPNASILYGSPYDCIVGDVILARRQGPELVPLTDQDIDKIEKIFRTKIRNE